MVCPSPPHEDGPSRKGAGRRGRAWMRVGVVWWVVIRRVCVRRSDVVGKAMECVCVSWMYVIGYMGVRVCSVCVCMCRCG